MSKNTPSTVNFTLNIRDWFQSNFTTTPTARELYTYIKLAYEAGIREFEGPVGGAYDQSAMKNSHENSNDLFRQIGKDFPDAKFHTLTRGQHGWGLVTNSDEELDFVIKHRSKQAEGVVYRMFTSQNDPRLVEQGYKSVLESNRELMVYWVYSEEEHKNNDFYKNQIKALVEQAIRIKKETGSKAPLSFGIKNFSGKYNDTPQRRELIKWAVKYAKEQGMETLLHVHTTYDALKLQNGKGDAEAMIDAFFKAGGRKLDVGPNESGGAFAHTEIEMAKALAKANGLTTNFDHLNEDALKRLEAFHQLIMTRYQKNILPEFNQEFLKAARDAGLAGGGLSAAYNGLSQQLPHASKKEKDQWFLEALKAAKVIRERMGNPSSVTPLMQHIMGTAVNLVTLLAHEKKEYSYDYRMLLQPHVLAKIMSLDTAQSVLGLNGTTPDQPNWAFAKAAFHKVGAARLKANNYNPMDFIQQLRTDDALMKSYKPKRTLTNEDGDVLFNTINLGPLVAQYKKLIRYAKDGPKINSWDLTAYYARIQYNLKLLDENSNLSPSQPRPVTQEELLNFNKIHSRPLLDQIVNAHGIKHSFHHAQGLPLVLEAQEK